MAEKRPKTMVYRKAEFKKGRGKLQAHLALALHSHKQVDGRLHDPANDGSDLRIVNEHEDYRGMRCGDFLRFEPGTNKLITSTDLKKNSLDVRSIMPPTIETARSEFIDGVLLFAVADNHVVMMQSLALRSNEFEDYINWLLKKQGVLAEDDSIYLVDQPQAHIKRKIDAAKVKSAAFRAPVVIADEKIAMQNLKRNEHVEVIKRGLGANIIRDLLGEDIFAKFDPVKLGDSRLKVEVRLSYDRKTDEDGLRFIKAFTKALRHIDLPDEDVTLDLPAIGKVKGTELKLAHSESIVVHDGVPDRTDVFKKMHEWILNLSKNGLIE